MRSNSTAATLWSIFKIEFTQKLILHLKVENEEEVLSAVLSKPLPNPSIESNNKGMHIAKNVMQVDILANLERNHPN
jgi:hypothetical protein